VQTTDTELDVVELGKRLRLDGSGGVLQTYQIYNLVNNALRDAGKELLLETDPTEISEEFLEGIDLKVSAQSLLDDYMVRIAHFVEAVEEFKPFLDAKASFSSQPIGNPEDLYPIVKSSSTTQHGLVPPAGPGVHCRVPGDVPAIGYEFNAYLAAMIKATMIMRDLVQAYRSRTSANGRVLAIWQTLEWHANKDPNIHLVHDLGWWVWHFAREAGKAG